MRCQTPLLLLCIALWTPVAFSWGRPLAETPAAEPWMAGQAAESPAEDMADAEVAQAVRSLLSNRCFACHGPDEAERQGGFRLDKIDSFLAEADSGLLPVVPGSPAESELLRRVATEEAGERMPPEDFGAGLTAEEVALISRWIEQGAELPAHWSFQPPQREELPSVAQAETPNAAEWSQHPVDRFVIAEQLQRGFTPSPSATRAELLRRLSLDLIGLPPTLEEVAAFEQDLHPNAYRQQVERLLASPAYGEHWARKWLDLARYADSAGYADDPERTIWGYRDWVVEAYNNNMPLDQFTIEQIAGDLLPNATQQQLLATAFHRNTLTNNEGGTNDEEFRNVAVVDRVNTTMAVWMGVTMACAQCHTHKFDPFTHEEYFQLFAIFNQSQDADRRDESPFIELFTEEQRRQQTQWQQRLAEIENRLNEPNELSRQEFAVWRQHIRPPHWQTLQLPSSNAQAPLARFDTPGNTHGDGAVRVAFDQPVPAHETYTLRFPLTAEQAGMRAISLETLPWNDLPGGGAGYGGGNFVISGVSASLLPQVEQPAKARFVRVALPGAEKMISLAEVQVFAAGQNIALQGLATQSSTAFAGDAHRAIDGNTDGDYSHNSTTHTSVSQDPWWELDLGAMHAVERLLIWNRTDSSLQSRLDGAVVELLDEHRQPVFTERLDKAPQGSHESSVVPRHPLAIASAHADYEQPGFPATGVLDGQTQTGWAVGGQHTTPHRLTLVLENPLPAEPNPPVLELVIRHQSPHQQHLLGSFAVSVTTSERAGDWVRLPSDLQAWLLTAAETAVDHEPAELLGFFHRQLAVGTESIRSEASRLRQQLAELKPATSVPVMRDRDPAQHRQTFVQLRGNYKALGPQVTAGTPEVFHPLQDADEQVDRLDLARWLVDRRNPLTARVFVNRLWESLFGQGIVRTSEEFGSQGDAPTHPELLDWLAVEAMDSDWDMKHMLRLLVTSQTYQQTSMVSKQLLELDQDNTWLARGPRVRLSAEMIRDQALTTAGVLSRRMYGPPVRPPQPKLGLSAAFGSNTDWTTSGGEDRYRRGVYTTWRRSNPYPSMATFDAPSREVCTLRRDSTNTPLQALVTLNDPAFVEAAQALARRVVLLDRESTAEDTRGRLKYAFRLCTSRGPSPAELDALASLWQDAREQLKDRPDAALQLATDPLGPLPDGADAIELAAWTAVANVLLNLDEVLMKR